MELLLKDPLEFIRDRATELSAEMLQFEGEHETDIKIVRMLVNKFGDGDKKVVKTLNTSILKALKVINHPFLQSLCIRRDSAKKMRSKLFSLLIAEMDLFLMRTNQSFVGIYNAITFLTLLKPDKLVKQASFPL